MVRIPRGKNVCEFSKIFVVEKVFKSYDSYDILPILRKLKMKCSAVKIRCKTVVGSHKIKLKMRIVFEILTRFSHMDEQRAE